MPTRARGPSTAIHSCSALYRSSSGKFMAGQYPAQPSAENLTDPFDELLREPLGIDISVRFGPHVGERFVRIGKHQRPLVAVDHLDPVDQLQLAPARALDDLA